MSQKFFHERVFVTQKNFTKLDKANDAFDKIFRLSKVEHHANYQ